MRLQRGCETLGINARPGVTPLWVIPEVPLEAKFPAVVLRTLKCTQSTPKWLPGSDLEATRLPRTFLKFELPWPGRSPKMRLRSCLHSLLVRESETGFGDGRLQGTCPWVSEAWIPSTGRALLDLPYTSVKAPLSVTSLLPLPVCAPYLKEGSPTFCCILNSFRNAGLMLASLLMLFIIRRN